MPQLPHPIESEKPLLKTCRWFYNHPLYGYLIPAGGYLLSLGLLALSLWTFLASSWAIGIPLSIVTAIVAVTTMILHFWILIAVPSRHDMSTERPYPPTEEETVSLYYFNDIPILKAKVREPFLSGYYSAKHSISGLVPVLERIHLIINQLEKRKRLVDFPLWIDTMLSQLPSHILLEMTGAVEGFNSGAKRKKGKVSLADALLMNLCVDLSQMVRLQNRQVPERPTGCTGAVFRDPKGQMILGHNVDSLFYGPIGHLSLLIVRQGWEGRYTVADLNFPGSTGCLAAMNEKGLSLVPYSCPGDLVVVKGLPSQIFARMLLETCATVDEALEFCKTHSILGTTHFFVADANKAMLISTHQGEVDDIHKIEHLEKGAFLVAANTRYLRSPYMRHYLGSPQALSYERYQNLTAFLEQDPSKRCFEGIQEGLGLPYVNNPCSIISTIMIPQLRKLYIRINNGYAGGEEYREVSFKDLMA